VSDQTELSFLAPGVPPSINKTKGIHWAASRRLLTPWRDLARAVAHNAIVKRGGRAKFRQVPISVQVTLPFRQGARRDPHNYTGTVVKAIVDGLKNAGLVPDDTADWVTVLDPIIVVVPAPKPLRVTITLRPTHPGSSPLKGNRGTITEPPTKGE
jgi:crossover junction endodeoxyribonuclease RusA